MCDESKIILNAEIQNQLKIQHDELLGESFKLLLLKKLLLEVENLSKVDEQILFALKIFRAREFLSVDNENLLNLVEDCSKIKISYNVQKELKMLLWQIMQTRFDSVEPLLKKLQLDFPFMFDKKQILDLKLAIDSPGNAELLNLDQKRRENLEKLAEIHNRKLTLLKAAADIKLSAQTTEKIEVLHLELSINQVKANLFRDYMINEFINSSENTFKAIKFVKKHIDKRLEEMEDVQMNKSKQKI